MDKEEDQMQVLERLLTAELRNTKQHQVEKAKKMGHRKTKSYSNDSFHDMFLDYPIRSPLTPDSYSSHRRLHSTSSYPYLLPASPNSFGNPSLETDFDLAFPSSHRKTSSLSAVLTEGSFKPTHRKSYSVSNSPSTLIDPWSGHNPYFAAPLRKLHPEPFEDLEYLLQCKGEVPFDMSLPYTNPNTFNDFNLALSEPYCSSVADSMTIESHTGDIQVLTCSWGSCNTTFETQDLLVDHIVTHHIGVGKASYICEWQGCTRARQPFSKRHKIQNHVRIHTGERPFICTVVDCKKRFSRLDGLNTHIKVRL